MSKTYISLMGDSSVNSPDATIADLTVTDNLTLTGCQIDTIPTDNSTIEYAAYQLKVKDNGVSSTKLQNNSVTTTKIADSNVTTAKIADANVTTAKIADGNVTDVKISAVSASKITGSYSPSALNLPAAVGFAGTYSNIGALYVDSAIIGGTNAYITNVYADTIQTTAANVIISNVAFAGASANLILNTSAVASTDKTVTVRNLSGTMALLSDISGSSFDQSLNTTDAVTFASVNTGFGNNDLYEMNQNVKTNDNVEFNHVKSSRFKAETNMVIENITSGSIYFVPFDRVYVPKNQFSIQDGLVNYGTFTTSLSGIRTWTMPDASGTIVFKDTIDVLTNKSLVDSSCLFVDDADNTKKMAFQLSGISTGNTRTITVPNASGNMALSDQPTTLSTTSNPTFANLTLGGTQITGNSSFLTVSNTTEIDINTPLVSYYTTGLGFGLRFSGWSNFTGADKTVTWPNQNGTPLVQILNINDSANTISGIGAGAGPFNLFPAARDSITVLGSTTYYVEFLYIITTGATTATKSINFSTGTATLTSMALNVLSYVSAVNTTGTAQNTTLVTQFASTIVTATGTAQTVIQGSGHIRFNAAGTFIPRIAFSTDQSPAAGSQQLLTNSYFKMMVVGSNTMTQNTSEWT